MRVLTLEETIKGYGDPTPYLLDDGSVSPGWPEQILRTFSLGVPLPLSFGGFATRISCHQDVLLELDRVFRVLITNPEVWHSIDDYGGCYQWRRNRNNPKVLSKHAWGIAVDLDVADNPNGTMGMMHPFIIDVFARSGWLWGGHFGHPDPMHFEKGAE